MPLTVTRSHDSTVFDTKCNDTGITLRITDHGGHSETATETTVVGRKRFAEAAKLAPAGTPVVFDGGDVMVGGNKVGPPDRKLSDRTAEWRDEQSPGTFTAWAGQRPPLPEFESWAAQLNAVSNDNSRPVLGGVFLPSKDHRHSGMAVCTDSYRLVIAAPPQPLASFDDSVLVPHILFQRLCAAAAKAGCRGTKKTPAETVDVRFHGDYATAMCGPVAVQGRLVEGEFPSYESLIPQQTRPFACFDDPAGTAAWLRNAAKTSATMIPVRVSPGSLSMFDQSIDQAWELVFDDDTAMSDTVAAFCPEQLADALETPNSAPVVLGLQEDGDGSLSVLKPGIVAAENGALGDGVGAATLIMPIRVN